MSRYIFVLPIRDLENLQPLILAQLVDLYIDAFFRDLFVIKEWVRTTGHIFLYLDYTPDTFKKRFPDEEPLTQQEIDELFDNFLNVVYFVILGKHDFDEDFIKHFTKDLTDKEMSWTLIEMLVIFIGTKQYEEDKLDIEFKMDEFKKFVEDEVKKDLSSS